MKKGIILITLVWLMVISLVLASCNTTTKTTTANITSTTTTSSTSTSTTVSSTNTSTVTTTAVTATTTSAGHWWDYMGSPQYGGTLTERLGADISSFDPYTAESVSNACSWWMEEAQADDWTVNPSVYTFQVGFRPSQYVGGGVEQSWELTDPHNYIIHLRQDVYWQNIAPVNGRQFTSADVVYNWNRILGLGNGFTKPSSYVSAVWLDISAVTALDKWTVDFTWKTTNAFEIIATQQVNASSNEGCFAAPEAIQLWGNLSDWHHAIGTGPFMLTDYVSGSSATVTKNPTYWGFDERHPQNKLPYVDKVKMLIIPDYSTALAAMRTGKIDLCPSGTIANALAMTKTNPEILQINVVGSAALTVEPRCDLAPFSDVRVREAMQKAMDLPTLAKTYYYGTVDPWPSTLASNFMGWGFPYNQWPQDLKDQYTYDTTAAKALLAAAGYANGFTTDLLVDNTNDMDLVAIVQSYLAVIGIKTNIQPMDTASFAAYVNNAHKNTGLVIAKSGCFGQNYDPLRMLRRFQTGYAANYNGVSDPVYDAFYTNGFAATSDVAMRQIFADANEYIAYHHFAVSMLVKASISLCQPWVKAYNSQSTSGAGFYAARYWVDQDLKSSSGH